MATATKLAFVLLALASFTASARDADGKLDVLLFPNEGCPAVVTLDGKFTAISRERGTLAIESSDGTILLDTKWESIPGGRWSADVRLPPGLEDSDADLAVRWQAGDRIDINRAALHIVQEFPETYSIAAYRDPEFQNAESIGSWYSNIPPDTDLVLLSGQILKDGADDLHRTLVERLAEGKQAVVVAPMGKTAQAYWGAQPYAAKFGSDTYFVWNGDVQLEANGWEVEELYRLRRDVVDDRWTVGLLMPEWNTSNVRAANILLVDEPLHYLLLPGAGATKRRSYPTQRIGILSLITGAHSPARFTASDRNIAITPTDSE